ncbi:phage tail assembly protein [Pseudomonas protegens]|uniref:Phage tail assembly protein n=1 Tax=Pseudomonas protegens TaxID=380021 RepID=A0A7G7XCY8_9PSED|nr:phage tail assembly protein [Pseudomonas protegens]QNH77833.1 phage tail assembly protein [Pseudomonas protegens]QNL07029.1 phage tail assembly protein [Pseudomonas protegens]
MADKLSIPLKFPFTSAAGVKISSLPITRLKRKDISAAQTHTKDEAAMEDFLLAKMTGVTIEDLMDLDIADSKTVVEVFREMAGGGDIAAVLGRSAVVGIEDAAI